MNNVDVADAGDYFLPKSRLFTKNVIFFSVPKLRTLFLSLSLGFSFLISNRS